MDWGDPDPGVLQSKLLEGQGAHRSISPYFVGRSMYVNPDGTIGQWYLQNAASNSGQVPELEPLVIQARQTYNIEQRRKLYSQIQQKALELAYSVIPLWYATTFAFSNKKVNSLDACFGGEGKPRYSNLWVAS